MEPMFKRDELPTESAGIPSGVYKCVIAESVDEPNKAGTGHFFKVTLEVVEGEHAGRKFFDRINHDNPNPKAVEIALRNLSSIMSIAGLEELYNAEQLENTVLNVQVVTKDDPEYGSTTDVKRYMAPNGSRPAAAQSAPPAAPPQNPAPQPENDPTPSGVQGATITPPPSL